MFGFGEDEEEPMSLFGAKKKKGDKKDPAEKSTIEEEFEEIKDDLISQINGKNRAKINLSEKSKKELVWFIEVFSKFFTKDFYSDKLTNALLRKFNFDKEYNM